jgi:hypothetical protein
VISTGMNDEMKKYLADNLGVSVLTVEEALKIARED